MTLVLETLPPVSRLVRSMRRVSFFLSKTLQARAQRTLVTLLEGTGAVEFALTPVTFLQHPHG